MGIKTKIKNLLLVNISIFLLTNIAAASVIYSSDSGVQFSTSDNIHNIPQLYSALVGVYGQSNTDKNIMTQVSSGVWYISTGLNVPQGSNFYINSSTCSELRLGFTNDYNQYSLSGYPIMDHTKLVGWYNGSPAPFSSCGVISINKPANDLIMDNFQTVSFIGLSGNCSVYNISMNSTRYYLKFPNANSINVYNITVTNSYPVGGGGLQSFVCDNSKFWDIHTYNTGDHTNPSSGSYGMSFSGSNNIVHDCIFDGSAWSTFNIFNSNTGDYANNNTVYNLTILNSGHNDFENEGNNSYFKNITCKYSHQINFLQKGTTAINRMSVNNVYENLTSIDAGSAGMKITEGSDNINVLNSTFTGYGYEIDDCSNVSVIKSTVNGKNSDLYGVQLTTWSPCNFVYDRDQAIVESSFTNMTYTGVYLYSGTGIKFVNYNGAFVRFNGDYTTYYYPNLIVKASDGTPIQGAAIIVNTTAVNGFGKVQKTFYTDSNGKLFDSGNRSNWLAIPDQKVDGSSTTSYVTKITATKNGKTDYTAVDPSSSWYSPNPAILKGSEIVLTIDDYSPYDFNMDGTVNESDVRELGLTAYGKDAKSYTKYDVNKRGGIIDLRDIVDTETNFSKTA